MLFNEIYSSYFNVVADVLKKACEGKLREKDIYGIVEQKAFGESVLNIPAALKNQEWKLLTHDLETPIQYPPEMPLTTLQKQWMKALLNDPRIRLFDPSFENLEDVRPLYEQEWIEYYDRYSDGDLFDDYKYQMHFKAVLTALREYRKINILYNGGKGQHLFRCCIPYRLEYSSKDDKFRLICSDAHNYNLTINISRIEDVKLLGHYSSAEYNPEEPLKKELTVELTDERNCLERFLLSFSHLEKEAKRIDDEHYKVFMKYDAEDETEILIRIISFGAKVKVISPDSFINLIKERLKKQEELFKL